MEWMKCFLEAFRSVIDKQNSENYRQMLAQNRRPSLRLIEEKLGISKYTVHTIVPDDLGKLRYVRGRSAPDLCRASSQASREQNEWKLLVISLPCVTRIHCFWNPSSREMRPGATSFAEQKKPSAKKGENTVDRLLQQSLSDRLL